LKNLCVFYTRAPYIHVRARLAEYVLENVQHNLIRTVTNGMDVLLVALAIGTRYCQNTYHLETVLVGLLS
jgi:hypothetical protein